MNDFHNLISNKSLDLYLSTIFVIINDMVAIVDLYCFGSKQLRICVLQQLNVYPVPHELCQLCKDCRE